MKQPSAPREQRLLDLLDLARQVAGTRASQQDWLQALAELCRRPGGDKARSAPLRGTSRLKDAARAAGAWRVAAIADRLVKALDEPETGEPLDAVLDDLERALRDTQQGPGAAWDAA